MRRISLLCEENLRISSPCSRQFGIANNSHLSVTQQTFTCDFLVDMARD
jgi:hypothetical protein